MFENISENAFFRLKSMNKQFSATQQFTGNCGR